jgi:outer membrane protein OmpA-like peptidoglycan-associated protein
MRLTPVGKLVLLLLIAGVAFGGYRLFGSKLAPGAKPKETVNVPKINLPDANPSTSDDGTPAPAASAFPVVTSSNPGAAGKPEVRMLSWAWNAQMGIFYANGGPQATQGSIMARRGVNLKIARQDDTNKMQEALIQLAQAMKNGDQNPKVGTHFVAVMGDGAPAFFNGINKTLDKLGPDYRAKVIAIAGYSRGEDKFMGPSAWKDNPQAAMGKTVAGVLRDGDWNIAMKWLGDNGLKNNPDEKTYDPDALNWIAANDYLDAAEKYISGYTEQRRNKKTGQMQTVQVDGVVTWTPGDVNIAQKKGGLVSIVSTKEYSTQMPCVVIGIDKWMKTHPDVTKNFVAGLLEGGDAVKRGGDAALMKAAAISAQIYNEQDAAYWAKYYKGTTEQDKQGFRVELGGSEVNGLKDTLLALGLLPGSTNLFEATYTVFGDVAKQQYPELMGSYYPAGQITDVSYLKAVQSEMGASAKTVAKTDLPQVPDAKNAGAIISERKWNIRFATGKAYFDPSTMPQLERMRKDLLIAGNTAIEIQGHTDNVGDPNKNMALSESRAFAVKQYLQNKSPLNFPDRRFQVRAFGQTAPVVPNTTEANRAQNRRVVIVLRGGRA